MAIANNPDAINDDQLESVAGGRVSKPDTPKRESAIWLETPFVPVELGGGAVACTKAGCNNAPMTWDGNSYLTVSYRSVNMLEFCFCFHCNNCNKRYAKAENTGLWYVCD